MTSSKATIRCLLELLNKKMFVLQMRLAYFQLKFQHSIEQLQIVDRCRCNCDSFLSILDHAKYEWQLVGGMRNATILKSKIGFYHKTFYGGNVHDTIMTLSIAAFSLAAFSIMIFGAVVKRRQEKRRWTQCRQWHKVDIALISQKVDDRRPTAIVKETKGRQY